MKILSLLLLALFLNGGSVQASEPDAADSNQAQTAQLKQLQLLQIMQSQQPTATPQQTLTSASTIPRQRLACENFGCFLFGGDFANEKSPVFSPEYVIAIGDKISIKIWGGVEYEQVHSVDAQGNIFLPKIGPIKVAGVKNRDLTAMIMGSLRKVYIKNVSLYAGLLETQPVVVYVSGAVTRPGAYGGTSANSLMYYLDRAGGINSASGSYLDISIIRGTSKLRTFNLYDFVLMGELPAFQFSDGDTILVGPRRHTAKVEGLVANPYRFEFSTDSILTSDLLTMAGPRPDATHIRITRNLSATRDVVYYPLKSAPTTIIHDGDEVVLLSDKNNGTITIRIEGEHLGEHEIALPYGSRLSDALKLVRRSSSADKTIVQLFRSSVAAHQKEMLLESLRSLEVSVLTARAGTAEEAKLRKDEADLFLKWIERAKLIQPKGQVVLTGGDPNGIILENGDVLKIPSDNALVMVHGEVLFPSTIAFRDDMSVADAIEQSGGYSQGKGTSRIVILQRDGAFKLAGTGDTLNKGEEVLVLPRVETKWLQFAKEFMVILYQIAVSSAVVLRL